MVLAQSPKLNPVQFQNPTIPIPPLPQSSANTQPSGSTSISTDIALTPQTGSPEQTTQETESSQDKKTPQSIFEEQPNYARNSRLSLPEKLVDPKNNSFFPSTLFPKPQEKQTKRPPQTKKLELRSDKPATPAISMKQITKSYFQCVEQERQGAIKSKRAGEGAILQCKLDAQEMATHAYTTKIWRTLRDATFALDDYFNLDHNLNTSGIITLTIDKKGKILDLTLQHSQKDRTIENIESLLQKAAFSTGLYPKIPKNINLDTMTFSTPVSINFTKGKNKCVLNYRFK